MKKSGFFTHLKFLRSGTVVFVMLVMIQWIDWGPCLGYPEIPLGPKIMLKQEKVKKFDFAK